MAHAKWVTPDKTSGSGNDSVSWQASEHTGRLFRTTTAIFTAPGCPDRELTINQAGKAEGVDMDDAGSIAQGGGQVTISGRSNSSKLTFSLANNNIGLTLPTSFNAGGATAKSGVAISGDPGASQEYEFSLTFGNVTANPGVTARTTQLIVTDNAGHTDTCTITQAAGSAYLTISPTTIELTAEGTAVSMSVESNTSWNIS